MIYVNRSQSDANGNAIAPNRAWLRRAEVTTKLALKEKKKHSFKTSVYRATQVRIALEELFREKCAYCETLLNPGYSWEVEHFRPKGGVWERPDHPGYYWLAYSWTNLFPSCTFCNQRRKDPPTWGEPIGLPVKGKGTRFPLVSERTRSMSPADDVYKEKTLLIDPTYDDPADYLGFDPSGGIFALEDNAFGNMTIEVFHLNRRRLKKARRNLIMQIQLVIGCINQLQLTNQKKHDMKREILQLYSGDSNNYAGAVRFYAQSIGI